MYCSLFSVCISSPFSPFERRNLYFQFTRINWRIELHCKFKLSSCQSKLLESPLLLYKCKCWIKNSKILEALTLKLDMSSLKLSIFILPSRYPFGFWYDGEMLAQMMAEKLQRPRITRNTDNDHPVLYHPIQVKDKTKKQIGVRVGDGIFQNGKL